MIAAPTPMSYAGTLDCTLEIWREEGLAGFFRGALINVLRGMAGSLVLVLWDQCQAYASSPRKANT